MRKGKLKFASMIVAYNEERLIKGCLSGLTDLFNIVGISTPWCGEHKGFDRTEQYAREMGAYIFKQNFKTEGEQRTAISKFAKEKGYDYIFVIDADEYYRRESIQNAMKFIEEHPAKRYDIDREYNFWKNENWEIIPRISKVRLFCVPTGTVFPGYRNVNVPKLIMPTNVILYHFSYVGPDERILSKITHFSHANEIRKGWYENVWKKWTPEMENIHVTGDGSHFKKAIPFRCPLDIKRRYHLQ